ARGEPDLLATFWVTAALAAFELGRRRGSAALQWIAAQALLAGAILTQAAAALFFHAPALLPTWRRRLRLRPLALVAGALLMLALVLAWLALYARSASTNALSRQLSAEIARHATASG